MDPPVDAPQGRRQGKTHVFLALLLITLFLAFSYRDAPKNTFHFDDLPNIVNRGDMHPRALDGPSLLTAMQGARIPQRLLSNLSLAVDWWRGDGSPAPFLWTNLLIHLAASWALFFLLHALLAPAPGALPAALLASALWACHPAQSQAVTYIVQRMASMTGLFAVLGVLCFTLGWRRKRVWLFLLAALSFLLGVLSKENGVTVLGLFWLAAFALRQGAVFRKGSLTDMVLLLLPVLLLAWLVVDLGSGRGPLAHHFLPNYEDRPFTLGERLLTQPRVLGFYLSLLLWPDPARLSLEHAFPISHGLLDPPSTLLALGLLLAWVAGGLYLLFATRHRLAGFFLLWVPVTLAPESSFIPLEMVFEHRIYLPSMGLAGLVALGVVRIWRVSFERVWLIGLLLPLALGGLTAQRVPVWQTRLGLVQDALVHAPDSPRVWANLGTYHFEAGNRRQAEPALRRAVALDPTHQNALANLGVLLLDLGRLQEAEGFLNRAVAAGEPTRSLFNSMGELRLQQGRHREAIAFFRQAVALADWFPIYRWNLALALEGHGDCARAHEEWQHYLRLEKEAGERARVVEHLQENYQTPGGKCYR